MRKCFLYPALFGVVSPGVSLAADDPLNYFLHSYGPASRQTMYLDWLFTFIAASVCVIIAVLLLGAIFHKRPAAAADVIGQEREGSRWIAVGTGVSVAVLFIMAVCALVALNDTATIPTPGLTITVTGYDWWWKVEYDGPETPKHFTTANEIHIPVGVPVLVKLKSADVIHAFWVPLLAGKTETIPGLTNEQWLQADAPGTYRGKCTQFCGAQHAHMDFEVVAQSAEDFHTWEHAQAMDAAAPDTSLARVGQAVFQKSCSACHTVRGSEATGPHGPDLTHLISRRQIASGLLDNTSDNLMRWVREAQSLKPEAQMPQFVLSPDDASALSAYLATLK